MSGSFINAFPLFGFLNGEFICLTDQIISKYDSISKSWISHKSIDFPSLEINDYLGERTFIYDNKMYVDYFGYFNGNEYKNVIYKIELF